VTVETGAYVTVAKPDIVNGWPERDCRLFWETLHLLKEVLLSLKLGHRLLRMWVFAENITDELIFGLDILRAYDASVYIGRQKLSGQEEVSLWSPEAATRPSRLFVAKDHVIPAECEGIVIARTESPLE
jgi:hypothetical protein